MVRKALCIVVAGGLALLPLSAQAQPPGALSDPEIQKGIKQVEEGDYDAGIVTLDAAARRLTGDPARASELGQAYLYLGIAYMGKGHEAVAKAQFREAISRVKNLTLTPDRFSPRIINVLETVKEEARSTNGPPAPAAAPVRTVRQPEGGGGKKTVLFLVLGVAAAGGAVLLLKGKGSEECFARPALRPC